MVWDLNILVGKGITERAQFVDLASLPSLSQTLIGKRWDSETWDRNIRVDVLENSNPQASVQNPCLEMDIEGGWTGVCRWNIRLSKGLLICIIHQ